MKRGQTSSPLIIPFFIEAIRTIQPFPDTLIDIGCGAGSVLTKDIPDNEIWAGNPAKKIGNVI